MSRWERVGERAGTYPVCVRRNSEGRIIEAKVVFIEDEAAL